MIPIFTPPPPLSTSRLFDISGSRARVKKALDVHVHSFTHESLCLLHARLPRTKLKLPVGPIRKNILKGLAGLFCAGVTPRLQSSKRGNCFKNPNPKPRTPFGRNFNMVVVQDTCPQNGHNVGSLFG